MVIELFNVFMKIRVFFKCFNIKFLYKYVVIRILCMSCNSMKCVDVGYIDYIDYIRGNYYCVSRLIE